MKKIDLHIVIYSDLNDFAGGRETWLRYFTKGVGKYYHKIYVYSAYRKNAGGESILNNCHLISPAKNRGYAHFITYSVINLIKYSRRGDHVIFCGIPLEAFAYLFYRPIAHFRKIQAVIWIRGMGINEMIASWKAKRHSKIKIFAYKVIFSTIEILAIRSSRIIFNGVDTMSHFADYTDNRNHIVIPNAISLDLEKIDRNQGLENIRSIGFVGRFTTQKGFDQYLEIVNLSSKSLSFHAWGAKLEDYVIPEGLTLHPALAHDRIHEAFNAIGVVLFLNKNLNSEAGGVSHAIIEAMYSGKIIIAWDNPTHRQVLSESTSIMIDEGNTEKVAEVISHLANLGKEFLADLQSNATFTSERYTVESHVELYHQFMFKRESHE